MTDLDRLVAAIDAADTGMDRHDLADALGLPVDTVLTLAHEAIDADRAYLSDRRLYSTAPF